MLFLCVFYLPIELQQGFRDLAIKFDVLVCDLGSGLNAPLLIGWRFQGLRNNLKVS